MNYWLFKTEPDEFSIQQLASSPNHTARWDGIRNYQARNFLRDRVQAGDLVLIYHGKIKQAGVVGTAQVVSPAYADPAQFDAGSPYYDPKSSGSAPRWFCIDIQWQDTFVEPVLLDWIKEQHELSNMMLLKQGRLSVQLVTEPESRCILQKSQRR